MAPVLAPWKYECPYVSKTGASKKSLHARLCGHIHYMVGLYSVGTGGPIHVSFPSGLTLAEVQRKNPLVVRGGRYRPPDCEARHRTAIIIPHRHREHHLKFLLYYLHPFLQRQQLNYGIYVIHQVRCIRLMPHHSNSKLPSLSMVEDRPLVLNQWADAGESESRCHVSFGW